MIKRQSPKPMYLQIAEHLKQQIIKGVYKEGAKIPTENELMKQFKASRTTVRLAIKEMMKDNLVETKPGKGTFVKEGKIYHNLEGFKGLYETLLEAGINPETKLLDFRMVKTSEKLNNVFGLKKSKEVLQIIRLYYMNQHSIALAQITLHPDLSNLISEEEARIYPVYQLLADKCKYNVKQANFEIFAENASREVAQFLQIKENDAVLGAERTLYSEKGNPVEHTYLWFRADSYRFTISLQGDTKIQLAGAKQFLNNKD